MNTSQALSHAPVRFVRRLEGFAYGLLLAWALFWITLALVGTGVAEPAAMPYVLLFLAAVAGTVIVAWRSVLAGAVLLLGAGILALHFSSSPSTLLLFAGPAFTLSLLFLVLAWVLGRVG
jgi:hypothetical protein